MQAEINSIELIDSGLAAGMLLKALVGLANMHTGMLHQGALWEVRICMYVCMYIHIYVLFYN